MTSKIVDLNLTFVPEKKYSYGGENPMNPDNAEVASIMTADTCNDLMSTVSTSAAAFRSKTPGLEIFKSNLNVARKNPVTKVDYGFIDAPVTNTNTVKNVNMGTSKSDSNKNNRNMKDTEGHPLKACASLEQESQRSDSGKHEIVSLRPLLPFISISFQSWKIFNQTSVGPPFPRALPQTSSPITTIIITFIMAITTINNSIWTWTARTRRWRRLSLLATTDPPPETTLPSSVTIPESTRWTQIAQVYRKSNW